MAKNILESVFVIDSWFVKNEYKGYDPYDLLDTRLFNWLITNKPILVRKFNRKLISWFIFLFPSFVIKLFKIRPNINAKAVGLILKAQCNLYILTNDKKYLNKAVELSNWLVDNRTKGLKGYGWGYPFDWSGSKLIPKYTPSSVVSTIIGDGFFSLYKITQNKKFLNVCNEICIFLMEDLNIDYVDNESICFSYTPIDNNHVINANLFAAEFLVRIGKELVENHYIEFGKKALNYSLKQQRPNGDFLYWGSQDNNMLKYSRSNSDHYHTGFEIRMLYKLWKHLNDDKIFNSLKDYFQFYVTNYFNDDNSINLFPNRKYPINIHACSEAILCNCIVNNEKDFNKVNIDGVFNWIQNTMLNKGTGLYYNEIKNVLGIKVINKFIFNRWSQAWMFLALTEYLIFNMNKHNEEKNSNF